MYTTPDARPHYSDVDGTLVPLDLQHLVSPFNAVTDGRRGLGFADLFEQAPDYLGPDDEATGLSGLGFTLTPASGASAGAAVGSVVPVVGTTIGGLVGGAIGAVSALFGGGGRTADPASAIWGHVQPSDVLTLAALHVVVQGDGWHDEATGQRLSSTDADFRAESLMAHLIGAQMPAPQQPWYDLADNHQLTKAEAWNRWLTQYGQGATLESVLRQSGLTPETAAAGDVPAGNPGPAPTIATGMTPPGALPAIPTPGFTSPAPSLPPTAFHPTGLPTTLPGATGPRTASMFGGSNTMLLVAGGAAVLFLAVALAGRKSRA